jgi:prephenate dehydrogenase
MACDPGRKARKFASRHNIEMASAERCAAAPYVILAVPVQTIASVVDEIGRYLTEGATVLDVASVKVNVTRALLDKLPEHVDIIGTHPLFGPQSARSGLAGHKIALCAVRSTRLFRFERFLTRALNLQVIRTTPEAHDSDMAAVQGLTHLIARVLRDLGPMPTQLTTRSFELMMQAAGYVGGDSEQLFQAIERENPFSAGVRQRFFAVAERAGRQYGEISRTDPCCDGPQG